ncbi:MAG: chromate transporter [Casimicrobiaceae bacterium]
MPPARLDASPSRITPTVRGLFLAFLRVGVSGFGGVMPFAHRMLVERERWLDEREFIDVLSLCQFLPGPNIVNVSIVVGRRFGGLRGAAAAFSGLVLLPFLMIVTLGALYGVAGQLPHVRDAFRGVASGAAGLVIAMAVRMGKPLRRSTWQTFIAAAAFVAIAVLRWPLPWVLLGLVPLSLLLSMRDRTS